MMTDDDRDDVFARDDDPAPVSARPEPWPVLVVDDDEQVHAMTRLLLGDFLFEGRPFAMISARSAAQARAILAERPDLPVVLLDVVMETQDAGLRLVHHIRHELGNRRIRIILRTGQPGQAPERDVVVAYDINDYKSKNDLTAQALFTSVVGALRGWRDLATIESLNRSLERRVAERTAELVRQRAQAEEQRRFIEKLVEMIPSPVWYRNAEGRFALRNRAFRDLFPAHGTAGEDSGGADGGTDPPPWAILTGGSGQPLPVAGGRPVAFETSVTGPDGHTHELLVTRQALSIDDDGPPGLIGIAIDITERRSMERALHQLAITDPLSGAHNRRHLLQRIGQAIDMVAETGRPSSLIMLDIDHFKRINDEHGHAAGDHAIRAVALEIRRHLRGTDELGRIGGEEFAILLSDTALEDADAIAGRLRDEIGAGIQIRSAYRSPQYNEAIGGATKSQHLDFKAIDFVCATGSPAEWAKILRRYRRDNVFHGGIGVYSSFVHLDTRGVDADWTGR